MVVDLVGVKVKPWVDNHGAGGHADLTVDRDQEKTLIAGCMDGVDHQRQFEHRLKSDIDRAEGRAESQRQQEQSKAQRTRRDTRAKHGTSEF